MTDFQEGIFHWLDQRKHKVIKTVVCDSEPGSRGALMLAALILAVLKSNFLQD